MKKSRFTETQIVAILSEAYAFFEAQGLGTIYFTSAVLTTRRSPSARSTA